MNKKNPKKLEKITYRGVNYFVRYKTDDFVLVSAKNNLTKIFCITKKEIEDDKNNK